MSGSVEIMAPGADIFASGCRSLVDPVNCEGTSGAGLALAFKHRFPDAVGLYERNARYGRERVGAPWCCWSIPKVRSAKPGSARLIYFFATKILWRDPSRLDWIREGLDGAGGHAGLVDRVIANWRSEVSTLAIPALGCGLGELDWNDVRPLLEAAGEKMAAAGVQVKLYPPHERAPARRRR